MTFDDPDPLFAPDFPEAGDLEAFLDNALPCTAPGCADGKVTRADGTLDLCPGCGGTGLEGGGDDE